jgi:SH3-like domain-containing protein
MTAAGFRRFAKCASLVAALSVPLPASAAEPAEARGPVTNLPLPRFVSMRADSANARRGPSLDQRVDWEFVRRGLPLEVTAEYGNWRRVRDADGALGWVHHTLLSGVRTALVRGTEPVPLRAEPAEAAVVRALAEPGVVGRLETCRDAWCEIDAGGVEGWLPRGAIWGVGPDEEIE